MGESKLRILGAFRQLMGAVVRLALRNGITYNEFSLLCKSLFVDIAAGEYGIKGRETNISRISMMTGLDRKEIKKIRDAKTNDDGVFNHAPDRMARILSEWYNNQDYISADGKPLELYPDERDPSFAQLVKDCAGGIAPITMIKEFKRSQVIEETTDGRLRVLQREYIPNYRNNPNVSVSMVNPDAIEHGSSMLVDHINTIFHNLYRDDMNAREQLDMRATNHAINKEKMDEFYTLIDELGMDYLTKVDQWLSDNSIDENAKKAIRLGVGIYSIQGNNKTIG